MILYSIIHYGWEWIFSSSIFFNYLIHLLLCAKMAVHLWASFFIFLICLKIDYLFHCSLWLRMNLLCSKMRLGFISWMEFIFLLIFCRWWSICLGVVDYGRSFAGSGFFLSLELSVYAFFSNFHHWWSIFY